MPSASSVRPSTVEELGAVLAGLAAEGRPVRPVGGATKLAWGAEPPEGTVHLDTTALGRIVEHNAGDFTAVVEAGARMADVQAACAAHGQMLALDPPLGPEDAATVGGVIATADSGPLRHRHGAPRDLVLGMTVVLSDGTVSRSGGKVIKNVAGYDVGKLLTGSFGTLGVVASVALRLHPLPTVQRTVVAAGDDAGRLARAALDMAARPVEASCLDLRWEDGEGLLLARLDGVAAPARADALARHLETLGLRDARVLEDDEPEWSRQRALQRRADGAVVRVGTRLTGLGRVLGVGRDAGGTVVARAGLGVSWIGLPPGDGVAEVRAALAPAPATVLDGAHAVRDPWPPLAPGAASLMRAVKRRFDPAGALSPGVFAGGI